VSSCCLQSVKGSRAPKTQTQLQPSMALLVGGLARGPPTAAGLQILVALAREWPRGAPGDSASLVYQLVSNWRQASKLDPRGPLSGAWDVRQAKYLSSVRIFKGGDVFHKRASAP
jgi:hypothetical protein